MEYYLQQATQDFLKLREAEALAQSLIRAKILIYLSSAG
jgi:hypothetical protein